jgi:putative flippase GtrA
MSLLEQTDTQNAPPQVQPRLADGLQRALKGYGFAGLLPQLSAYTVASALALGVDLATFNALLLTGMRAALAGVVGYAAGLVLHYFLSSRYVFRTIDTTKTGAQRFAEFGLSGAVGIAMTWGIIHVATDFAHLPAMVGKAAAVAASFIVVFVLRRSIVFAGART